MELIIRHRQKPGADFSLVRRTGRSAVPIGDPEIALKERLPDRAPPDGEEINDLDEQLRPTVAGLTHSPNELFEPRQKAIVADSQKGTAGDVPDASCFDDDGAWLTSSEPLVPRQHVIRHEPILGSPPGNHGRDPRAIGKRQTADRQGTEKQ